MDTVQVFSQLQQYYGEELAIFQAKRTKNSNKIWEELIKNNSTDDALELYNSDIDNVGSKAWFKANPDSYQTVDMKGFEYLRQGFIIGVIDIEKTNKLLQKHLDNL